MKIPTKINILSDIYTIKIEPDLFLSENSDKMLRGEIDSVNRIIRLAKSENTAMVKTLLHEIIHGICLELGLFQKEHNELFIDRLAVGIIDTLMRNKMLKE